MWWKNILYNIYPEDYSIKQISIKNVFNIAAKTFVEEPKIINNPRKIKNFDLYQELEQSKKILILK